MAPYTLAWILEGRGFSKRVSFEMHKFFTRKFWLYGIQL